MELRIESKADRWQVYLHSFDEGGMLLRDSQRVGYVAERAPGVFAAHDDNGLQVGLYAAKGSAIRALRRRRLDALLGGDPA